MDSGANAREHFIKQRRIFMAVSLFLIFYTVADLEMTQINILGNYTTIGNPAIIGHVLALTFMYAFWRYYTACREVDGISKFMRDCAAWAEATSLVFLERRYKNKRIFHDPVMGSPVTIRRQEFNGFGLAYKIPVQDENSAQGFIQKEVIVKWPFRFWCVFSVIPITFRTSVFTEYVLPYVLGILALSELLGWEIVDKVMS